MANRPGILTATLDRTGGGALVLTAANTYSGDTVLGGGVLELGDDSAAGTGAITFGADDATLKLDPNVIPTNAIAGFNTGDMLDIAGFNSAGALASLANGALTLSDGAETVTAPNFSVAA